MNKLAATAADHLFCAFSEKPFCGFVATEDPVIKAEKPDCIGDGIESVFPVLGIVAQQPFLPPEGLDLPGLLAELLMEILIGPLERWEGDRMGRTRAGRTFSDDSLLAMKVHVFTYNSDVLL
jgi:hypothetical protein